MFGRAGEMRWVTIFFFKEWLSMSNAYGKCFPRMWSVVLLSDPLSLSLYLYVSLSIYPSLLHSLIILHTVSPPPSSFSPPLHPLHSYSFYFQLLCHQLVWIHCIRYFAFILMLFTHPVTLTLRRPWFGIGLFTQVSPL